MKPILVQEEGEPAIADAPEVGPDAARAAGYREFFDRFHEGRFFEAHEVLEVLWLARRRHPEAAFYQALIQVAGAFVHLDKGRPSPAVALLKRALGKLSGYPPHYGGLNLVEVRGLLQHWIQTVEGPLPLLSRIRVQEAGKLPRPR